MNVLNVENVSKNFTVSGKNLEVINSLSFDIEKGESVAVLGDNGAGKTTLLRMICGLISQDSGSIKLFGKEPLNNPLLLADVGVSLEGNRSLYWRLNPIENIEYFGILKGICSAMQLPMYFVRPAKWKKYYGLINSEKDASRTRAIEMFPYFSSQLSKKKD